MVLLPLTVAKSLEPASAQPPRIPLVFDELVLMEPAVGRLKVTKPSGFAWVIAPRVALRLAALFWVNVKTVRPPVTAVPLNVWLLDAPFFPLMINIPPPIFNAELPLMILAAGADALEKSRVNPPLTGRLFVMA